MSEVGKSTTEYLLHVKKMRKKYGRNNTIYL